MKDLNLQCPTFIYSNPIIYTSRKNANDMPKEWNSSNYTNSIRTTNSVRKPNEIGNRNPTLPQSKSIRLNIFAIFPQRKVET